MTTAALFAIAVSQGAGFGIEFRSLFDNEPRLWLRVPTEPLSNPKLSPLHEYAFKWTVTGMVGRVDNVSRPRFRIYRQSRTDDVHDDVSLGAGRYLLRLWDINRTLLNLDHSQQFQLQSVSVYLCDEGQPGGEHKFDQDPFEVDTYGKPVKVNTIYVYSVQGFTDWMEWARELAHEYGHATLPPVRVDGAREDWANGDLGERIYIAWMAEAMNTAKATEADTMGATSRQLEGYLNRKVRPLVDTVLLGGPDKKSLEAGKDAAFDAYLALACYARETFPVATFRRSLMLNAEQRAPSYLQALEEACAEVPELTFKVPGRWGSKPVWLPVNKGTIAGGKVLARSGVWAKVRPNGTLTIKNPPVQ